MRVNKGGMSWVCACALVNMFGCVRGSNIRVNRESSLARRQRSLRGCSHTSKQEKRRAKECFCARGEGCDVQVEGND